MWRSPLGVKLLSNIAQTIGALGVIISLTLVAWQTKELRKQIEISNLQSRYQTLHNAIASYHNALGLIYNHPELRPYFYERQACPQDDPNRPRALVVAEIIADSIDHAIRVAGQFPGQTHRPGWKSTALDMAKQPIFIEVLTRFPEYFPDLLAIVSELAVPAENKNLYPDTSLES